MEEVKLFEISAKSKDGQGYIMKMKTSEKDLVTNFKEHMCNKFWDCYNYEITEYKEVKNEELH